ncbi:hypothetical protein OTU49_010669 [Cherax quadricarinatus]|uniref:Glycoprotein-N-acetylgalactosamine 3-beta-galactosyltransferase 1 n=1 Tax=Cherax quadricarinatus TaxID=27406 RepID=A0AAW0WHM4_CHEQU
MSKETSLKTALLIVISMMLGALLSSLDIVPPLDNDRRYAVMENLRYMLAIYDPNFPIYFGSRFKLFTKQGYMSGGGGYVLSREALKQFIEVSLPNKKLCKGDTNTGAEDAELGKCLDNIGVVAGDSRDSYGRGRFFPFTPVTHLFGLVPDWYLDYVYYKPDMGLNCCSDSAVAFHYVDSHLMYQLEYLLYHLRPHGVYHRLPDPAPLPPDTKSIPFQALRKVAGSGWVAAATERPQQVNHEEQKYMNAVD